jgi:hypothetical protein
MKQEEEVEASASQQEVRSMRRRLGMDVANDWIGVLQEILRRQAELREKKQKEYESLSYEEQQKLDALNEKKMARKRMGRKVRLQAASITRSVRMFSSVDTVVLVLCTFRSNRLARATSPRS